MSEGTSRKQARLDPAPAWTVVTDAPLKGLALAREAGVVLAWDEGDHLYLFDVAGRSRSATRAPARVSAGTISDDGSLIVLLVEGPRVWFLSPDLELLAERPCVAEPLALAVDPFGRYAAVASRNSQIQFYNRHGQASGRSAMKQPLAHLCFVPDRPVLLGASAYGTIVGMRLRPGDAPGRLAAEALWSEALLSNVGRLTTTGDGGMVLASCFTHGVQRYDARGRNEGSYHLGGTAAQAVADFAGRTIAVATQEGELSVLNRAGNVRWKTGLPRPALGLECDPLGRYLIYGLGTGEITRLNLEGSSRTPGAAPASAPAVTRARPAREGAADGPASGSIRAPSWTAPVAQSDEQAESAVVAVLDEPARVAVITNRNRVRVFSAAGDPLGEGPEISGVGRILRTAPGWIVAATDRMAVLYDARLDQFQRLDLSLVEMTHLVPRIDTFGVAIVQERDRLGRATPAGRWIWKRELNVPVEEVAVGPDAFLAVTTEDGQLWIFDGAGEPAGGYQSDPAEAMGLIEAPEGSPEGVAWLTLAHRLQVLRGHDLAGRVVWEAPVSWESWQLQRFGGLALVAAPDGRALAFDGSGQARDQGRAHDPPGLFGPAPDGRVWRIVRQGVHLICTDLPGEVQWRCVAEAPLGPLGAGRAGVAVLIGRSLAWLPHPAPAAEQEMYDLAE